MHDLVLPAPDALAGRLAALSTERLVALVRANSPGLSDEAGILEDAILRELEGRMPEAAFVALCDALA